MTPHLWFMTGPCSSSKHVHPHQPQVDLSAVRLLPDTQLLGDIEVSAAREFIEIGIDRTVYNTRDQLVSIGGNASDVLQNIPSVEVDIDGNVSLRGLQCFQ